ncbi:MULTISPECIES: DUF3581 domain-containing protein [Halomonadaceae]|jgi:hypothetical protein|uniref:DUF3581 domain-containing protein n=1 Tax=Halomonadaceae TaxID=28256 RepID=UPI001582DF36|nr:MULTISPECIES: DUF3581 domain-containing protein [Halomonas]MDI4638668.1 DUF3581 domain-containing protein [Halomonas sp. BMC7]NUJ59654.1 DUF3581 domain-containing protein [Halomonas taeanensis]|tara:strand:- start:25777 stop:26490 length:714 start_codon:yes stop_codon:yes gene_type:complete
MFLDKFHQVHDGRISISAEQASHFAKQVAGDYNPIHNPDARRFCVPGDLLFALVLSKFGLSQCMTFHFRSMVGAEVALDFQAHDDGSICVTDEQGKVYLEVERSGDLTHDEDVIAAFTRRYVAFSGKNFPHYLKPLMQTHGVMFNPQRPLVIYDSMGFSLDRLDVEDPGLELEDSSFEVLGKRGEALLEFGLTACGQNIGRGSKKLVVSGLRDYDTAAMDEIVCEFYRLKAAYEAAV